MLIPNTELGHIILSAKHLDAEKYASSAIRENEELGYKKWAKRLTKYYGLMEKYFNRRRRREPSERKVPAVRGYQDPDRARQAA